MTIMDAGYYPKTYFPSAYFPTNPQYFPEYGLPAATLMENGYWNVKYWPSLYWTADYWPKYGAPAAPSPPTPTTKQGMLHRRPYRPRRVIPPSLLDNPEFLELFTIFLELD